jgi:hypothetical protein
LSALVRTSAPLVVDAHEIGRDGDLWCLTDMWKASGSPKDRRPVDFLRTDAAKLFVEFIADSMVVQGHHERNQTVAIRRAGASVSTWAHWQIALAYAKALSPAFHARVNEIYKAFVDGRIAGQSSAERELVRLALLSAPQPSAKSVWPEGIFRELARLWKIDWNGKGKLPRLLRLACGFVWKTILGDEVYSELRKRNPHPGSSSLHYHWLSEQRHAIAKSEDFRVAHTVAILCTSRSEFKNKLRCAFGRGPLQLGMAV